jgi:hypothetical protein
VKANWSAPSTKEIADNVIELVQRGVPEQHAVIKRLEVCGRANRYEHVCGEISVGLWRCESAHCPRCSLHWSRTHYRRILKLYEGRSSLRHVTLNLGTFTSAQLSPASPGAKGGALRRLLDSFARLRRRKLWRDSIERGVAAVHLEPHADGSWNVHLHAIVEGKFVPQALLKAAWHAVTKGKGSVDIRAITSTRSLRNHVRYMVEPGKRAPLAAQLTKHQVAALIDALRGAHMLTTFGQTPRHLPRLVAPACKACGKPGASTWVSTDVGPTEVQKVLFQTYDWNLGGVGSPFG